MGNRMEAMTMKVARSGFGRPINFARTEPVAVAKHGRRADGQGQE
jgi:hypothetical protein